MAKKPSVAAPGIPEWVLTYGDLMSLLLCFFILLAAFSELKKPRELQKVLEAIKEAFGYVGGVGFVPTDLPPDLSVIEQLETIQMTDPNRRQAEDPSQRNMEGRRPKVSTLHEGQKFPVGGSLVFSAGDSGLTEDVKRSIQSSIIPKLQGKSTKVEIRGHAFGIEDKRSGLDYVDLGYERAKAVRDFMIEQGIDPKRIIVVTLADAEPETYSNSADKSVGDNRRVQILETEVSVSDRVPNAYLTSPDRP